MSKLLNMHVKKLMITSKKEKDMFVIDNNIDNFADFNIKIKGPRATPYQGALFVINIHINNPLNYPKDIPSVKFITQIKHPNINLNDGTICLDILKNQWNGNTMELIDIIKNIYYLLQCPNPDDPYNVDIVNILKKNYKTYLEEIVSHTKKFGELDKNSSFLSNSEIENLTK